MNDSMKEQIAEQKTERYAGLISAIEFFSARFDVEQIVEYSYEFVRKLLPIKRIALWTRHEEWYVPVITDGEETDFSFAFNESYDQIVHFHAGMIFGDDIKRYFPKEMAAVNGDMIIPLVMDKSLYGVILVKSINDSGFDKEDVIIAEALMNLFATSLTNYRSYKDLEQVQVTLDEKIFNLFAINQSTKALLSEKNLENLYTLSIGVFAELTQSSYTTFFIFDEKSETFKLKSSRHVFDVSKNNLEITLYPNRGVKNELPVMIDLKSEADLKAFNTFFVNSEAVIETINPLYIVILKKYDQVVGFVTLGEKVNQKPFDTSILELIESLASSTYIAITNATYIERINEQKALIGRKLDELIGLNNLMKSINAAKNCHQIQELVLSTLNNHFNVSMAFFATYETEELVIQSRLNIDNKALSIPMKAEFEPLLSGSPVLMYDEISVRQVFSQTIEESFQVDPSGLVMLPIYIEVDDENPIQLQGILALLASSTELMVSEENMVRYEAITTHLAPVLYQMQSMENLRREYQVDFTRKFEVDLEQQIKEAISFRLELYVVYMVRESFSPFKLVPELTEIKSAYSKVYPINTSQLFIILNNESKIEDIEMLYDMDYNIKVFKYTKDFCDVEEFVDLLS